MITLMYITMNTKMAQPLMPKVFLGFDAIAYETKTNCGFWQEKWTIDYTEIDSVELKCCHSRERRVRPLNLDEPI